VQYFTLFFFSIHQQLKESSLLASDRTSKYISRISYAVDPAIFTQRAGDSKYKMIDIQLREVYYDANRGPHRSSRIASIQCSDGGYLLNPHEILHSQQKEAPIPSIRGALSSGDGLRNPIPTNTTHSQKEDAPIHPYNDEMGVSPRYVESSLPIKKGRHIVKYEDTTCDNIVTTQAALLIGFFLREARSAPLPCGKQ